MLDLIEERGWIQYVIDQTQSSKVDARAKATWAKVALEIAQLGASKDTPPAIGQQINILLDPERAKQLAAKLAGRPVIDDVDGQVIDVSPSIRPTKKRKRRKSNTVNAD